MRRNEHNESTDFSYTALYVRTYQSDQLEHEGLKKYKDYQLDISTRPICYCITVTLGGSEMNMVESHGRTGMEVDWCSKKTDQKTILKI